VQDLKNKLKPERTGGMAHVVECLSRKYKTLVLPKK
jgi:hypothetical protein